VGGTPFTTLTPAGLADEFSAIAREVSSRFGGYDIPQLNWQPQADRWSIAQCFDHLVRSDDEMFQAMDRAFDRTTRPTVWQRLPLWPRLFGWMLITSQAPGGTQKFTAPAIARPASSDITPQVIEQFIARQHRGIDAVRALGVADAQRIMASPFKARITYSVLDGYRLIAAHQRRHFEQARRVAAHPDFPRGL
jgi:hypothetical protein